jgi:hypothetical protein
MDMAALRARKQGPPAPTYYKTTLDPYGPTQEENIAEFIERLLHYMQFHMVYYSIMAMELEQGRHLIGAAKSKWIAFKQLKQHVWEDVIRREDPRDPNSVQSAVQYLQDMILAHLVVFRHAKTPTTRTEVQAAIDTAFIPARNHGGTYALFKRILELLKQLLSLTGVPPYDTVLEAVLGGLRRSGKTQEGGVNMAMHLEMKIGSIETDRAARADASAPPIRCAWRPLMRHVLT